MSRLKTKPRKKVPKQLALIDADTCTGCGTCIEICPTSCIEHVEPRDGVQGHQLWCEVDWDHCIGCQLCIRLPSKKDNPHTLTVCPWGAIEMIPLEELPTVASKMGGPSQWIKANRERLVTAAQHQVILSK